MPSKKVSDKTTAAELTPKFLELRRHGFSIGKIAQRTGKSKSYVHKYISRALDELNDKTREETAHYKQLQIERYEGLLQAVATEVGKGNVKAVDTARRVLDSLSRLTGAEAPHKIAPTNPDGTAPYSDPAAAMTEEERLKRIAELQKKLDDGK
jgi:hypothetical protein